MYSVKLAKIHSNHENLRTNEIEGVAEKLPVVGGIFIMTGESLTSGASFRQVTTSPIQSIIISEDGSSMIFSTMNSEYSLQYSEIKP